MIGSVRHRLLVLAVAAVAATPPALACDEAVSWSERTVCQYPELQEEVRRVNGQVDRLLRLISTDDRQRLRSEQKVWTAGHDACRAQANPIKCLNGRHQDRLAELDRRIGRETQALRRQEPLTKVPTEAVKSSAHFKLSSLDRN